MRIGIGISMRALHFTVALLLLGLSQQAAQANYILTPKRSVTGASSDTVAPGGSTAIDFILSSTAPAGTDKHVSNVFQVRFTSPGLLETTYLWASPFTSGTTSDDSTPNIANKGGSRPQTPTTITASTFVTSSNPNGVDIEFTNTLDPDLVPKFTTGTLVTMNLQVPLSWSGPNSVIITAVPDGFADGFTEIPTTAGPNFTLNISVPEPGSLSLAGLSLGAILLRRRRRNPSLHAC